MKRSGQMPKSYLLNWETWWLKRNPSMGWWYGRAHRIPLLPSPLTPILYSWLCYLERKSNGTSLRPCMWRQRDLGVDLLYPIPWDISIRSDKEGQSIYGPLLAPWRRMSMFRASLEARRQYRSLHWAGVRLHMNWCSITLDWIAPSIGMHSCLKSCRRFSSWVPQPVGLLLWKCLEPRTLHRPTAECPTCCGPTQWPWFGTFWWVVEWDDTRVPQTHWYLTSALTLEAFVLAALLA